jgi:hypothetical protein
MIGPSGSAGPAGGGDDPLQVVTVSHGAFPEISRLNPEFVAGRTRLKVTLRIPGGNGSPPPESWLSPLEAAFPSLSRHRCCGENSLRDSFFLRGRRRSCAVEEPDPGVDLAHLAEHLMIDIQHFVGRMSICSGVTCAYREPRDMYDIFVECPEEKVGLLSASIATGLINDLLSGRKPEGGPRCLLEAARLARDKAGQPVSRHCRDLEMAWGSKAVIEAIDYLRLQGFLTEGETTVNFSGEPMLAYVP